MLLIDRVAGGKPEVIFSLDSKLAATETKDKVSVPKDHKFVLTGLGKQSLSVLTSEPSAQGVCVCVCVCVHG